MAKAVPKKAAGELLKDADEAVRLYRLMVLVRRFEERTEEQYTRARIGGYCHLAIGEEAANVGAIAQLRDSDYLFTSYRDHAAALAVGSEPAAVMAELFGKSTGVAGGYGGSMHLLDVERNFLGGWGIVGGHLPIAVGAAFALDYRGEDGVVLCQLGDGATNIGAFHESLNLAAIWKLPIVFQITNNLYGMGTSVDQASAEPELWKRGCAYRMHGERVDGNDLAVVHEAAGRLLEKAREDREPSILETTTYRFRGHSVADAGKLYRTKEEIDAARELDPIPRFASQLKEAGILSDDDVQRIRSEVNDEVAEAIREAASAPVPDVDKLYDNVYGDPAWKEQFSRMGEGGPFGEREGTRQWRR
jgi:pyruvate dehydrogenase E1 component alpha subunit